MAQDLVHEWVEPEHGAARAEVVGDGPVVVVESLGERDVLVPIRSAMSGRLVALVRVPRWSSVSLLVDDVVLVGGPGSEAAKQALKICIVDCFAAGTSLRTTTGLRRVECLEPGDLVMTGAGKTTRVQCVRPALARRLVRILVVREGATAALRVSSGHRFTLSSGSARAAGELGAGDQIRCSDGGVARVMRVDVCVPLRPARVYTLALAEGATVGVSALGLVAESGAAASVRPATVENR